VSVHEIKHPLVRHKLGLMRRATISTKDFRELASEVARLLTYEATCDLETEQELIDFCRERLAHFKCPKFVEFMELPKTSTGKVQKFVLRSREFANSDKRIG